MHAYSAPSLSLFDAITDLPAREACQVRRLVQRRLTINLESPTISKPVLFTPAWRQGPCPKDASLVTAARVLATWWVTFLVWHAKTLKNEIIDVVTMGLGLQVKRRNTAAQQIFDAERIGKLPSIARGIAAVVPNWILFAIGYTSSIRTNKMTQIINAQDAGGAGNLKWFDSTRPATGGTATTLLGTLTLSATSATVTTGVLTYNAITNDSSADATSTVTWGRVTSGGGTFCFDLNVNASGGDIVVNTASIVTGAVLSVTSWTITDGNG